MQSPDTTKTSSLTDCTKADMQACCAQQPSQWKHTTLVTVIVGIVCTIPSILLVASAFVDSDPDTGLGDDGLETTSSFGSADAKEPSEASRIAQAFVLGWLFCLGVKLSQTWVSKSKQLSQTYVRKLVSYGSAGVTFTVARVQAFVVARKEPLLVIGAGVVCMLPIIALIVSAFTAIPGHEPGENGLASESSPVMRAFTMGWMFCLALKLCREFVGLVGCSSAAALLSC